MMIAKFARPLPSFSGCRLRSRSATTPRSTAIGAGNINTANNPAYPAKTAHTLRPTGSNIRMAGSSSMRAGADKGARSGGLPQ